MSVACLECNRIGAFNTLIVFDAKGVFDLDVHVSSYPNFYTCCASPADFKGAVDSKFMIAQTIEYLDRWNTGTDGERVRDTEHKRIDEAELRRRLPRIFEALTQKKRTK